MISKIAWTAVLLAAIAILGGARWASSPEGRFQLASWRAGRAPRDRWGGPLRPAPLVSIGRPVRTSSAGGAALVDGIHRGPVWAGGFPSPERPAWAAIDLGPGRSRVLVSWTSSHNHDYRDLYYGAPVDYRIETSADSSDGEDGRWTVAVSVTGNPVRSRAHAVDFRGQRWVRLVVTRLASPVHRWGLSLDEIDVHDLSRGGDDIWVFLGDSIGAGVFDRAADHRPSFADDIAAAHPGYRPAMIDAGFCRARTSDVLERIDDVLALNPDARVFAIALGSNDGDPTALGTALEALLRRIRAAGRIAVVARIPFRIEQLRDSVAPKNAVVDALVARNALVPGPDPYTWFKARPQRLADGLHPDPLGAVAMNRLWAEAVAPLYPR